MELILICIAVFLAGALIGFGIATIYSSANTIRLYDERNDLLKELAETRAEKQALEETIKNLTPPLQINIADDTVAKDVDFSKDWG